MCLRARGSRADARFTRRLPPSGCLCRYLGARLKGESRNFFGLDGGIALNKLKRLFSLLILAVSLSLTGVSSASGTDYYVSTSGSDSSGDGSSAHPWATIAYASTRI